MPRTKGSYQQRTFLDTNLGRYIFLHDSISYDIICPKNKEGFKPNLDLVLLICKASKNPSFTNKRFFSYVDQFFLYGLRVARKKPITPSIIAHYEKLKARRIKNKIKKIK